MKKRIIPLLVSSLVFGLMTNANAAGISAGDLIVSKTIYSDTGAAAGLVAGTSILPNGGTAIGDGSFANVFTNETPDASFGVTSAIYLDEYNSSGTGTALQTINVDTSQIVSSFASKSELALNVSSDGSSVSFMGYSAPVGALDVSNSNTAAVFDSTNPVTSTYSRAIGTVNLNTGALSTIDVNAYSGNNGRAAALVNGNYYMVGNAGNGSATGNTLSNLSNNTGVQMISATGSGNTTVVGAPQGTYGSANGYQNGFSVANAAPGISYTADKTGKDDNFRGLTVFNNTLYVTKGSGSNGINTVYQVGNQGDLANPSFNPSTAAITIMPGFNTALEKPLEAAGSNAATNHPFGLWFANSTTLFVADEGDGKLTTDATKHTDYAGLQEWVLSGGTWSKSATFQQGLIGQTSTSGTNGLNWNVTQDGLRNITGRVNADGTYTIIGTTSTVSNIGNHDLGADPNEIVSITIGAGSTGANTAFTVLQSADVGTRLGGVAFAPSSIAAVPEPETYGMMLGGLGLIGFIARRRKDAKK